MARPSVRVAIYCRKSLEKGLEQNFNSLDAQRAACEAYVASQKAIGWTLANQVYEDAGFTGANTSRPGLTQLLADLEARRFEAVIVYRADRLSRSLLDFTKLLRKLEQHDVAFVSVTEQFNTTSAGGRLMLNMLASFAEYERDVIAERTRDKVMAARKRGKWTGGIPMLGYDVHPDGGRLVVNEREAETARAIFALFLELGSLKATVDEMRRRGWERKRWTNRRGQESGGGWFNVGGLKRLLTSPVYLGQLPAGDETVPADHDAIIDDQTWQRVQTLLARRTFERKPRVGQAKLSGLVTCSGCSKPMRHASNRKGNKLYRYYVCGTAQDEGRAACPIRAVSASDLEDFVVEELSSRNLARHQIEQVLWNGEEATLRLREATHA